VITPSRPQNQQGGVQVYTLPGSRNAERGSNSESIQRSSEPQNVPERSVAPSFENRDRSGGSNSSPNPGTMRSEPARSQESHVERGGGSRPAPSAAPSSSGRSTPERNSSNEDHSQRRGR
jgi:hypothetical protein